MSVSLRLSQSAFLQSTAGASLVVAVSGAIWGLWWLPLRALEQSGLAGNWANVTVYAGAGLILLPFVLRQPRRSAGTLRNLLAVGLLSGASFSLWNHALIYGDVVRVTLLFYLSPVWATLFGIVLLRDRVSPLRGLSIVSGLAGAMLVLDFHGVVPVPRNPAEWMSLASGVLFALLTVHIRRTEDVGALDKTFASLTGAIPFALGLIFLLPDGPAAPALATLAAALPILLLCCLWLASVMLPILWGAGRLDPGRVGILLLFEVLAAALSAAILTDEPFGWREGLGCLFILAAGAIEGLDQLREKARARTSARPA